MRPVAEVLHAQIRVVFEPEGKEAGKCVAEPTASYGAKRASAKKIMKRGSVKNMLFDELVESIKEAGRIHRGEIPPNRKFVFEPTDIEAIRKGKSSKVTRPRSTSAEK